MKKLAFVLLITAMVSTTVFAAPLSTAGSWDLQSQEVFTAELSSGLLPDSNDLFADIQSVQMTDAEAEADEGDGIFAAAVLGAAGGAIGLLVTGSEYGWNVGGAFGATIGALLFLP